MRAVNRLCTRLLNFAARRRSAERLREEIDSHITFQTEENMRGGMAPGEARRRARLKFGPVEAIREDYRAERGLPSIDNLLLDLRYALRVLRKSPAFTIVAVLTLTLGIGANVVVFGVLNAVMLHPLAVSDPQNLYQIRHQQWMKGKLLTTSYPAFEDLQRRNTTFSGLAGINAYSQGRLSWRNALIQVAGDEVTGNYFDLLGVEPQAGRFFHAADEHGPDSAPYIVLSDALWRSAFQSDPAIVGAAVELNKHPFTVIGVTPAKFHGTERFAWPDYWMPMVNERQMTGSDSLRSRTSIALTVIGRLKAGVTPRQATENLNAITAQLAKDYPETDDGQPLRLIHPGLIGDEGDVIRGFLLSVNLLALLVLLAACANLATLFAARAADRSQELALRVALGSNRRRLVSQLLTEAGIVSLIGGGAGLASAGLLLVALNRWQSPYGHLEVSVDARVYLAGLALTLASALLSGMLPAWRAWQTSPLQGMKGGPADGMHLGRFTLRDLLLGVQIAICTLLVTASLTAVRGMERTLHAPLGFQPQGAMLINVDLSTDLSDAESAADGALEKRTVVLESTLETIRRIPGVTAAGAVSRTPMTGGMHGVPVFPPGTTEFKLNNSVLAPYVFPMSPGYLEAAGTRLLSGRDLSWQDKPDTPYVAVVNETFARTMWSQKPANQTPALGQRFLLRGKLTEVVGVAEDGKYHDLQEPPQAVAYLPISQSDDSEAVFVVRSPRPPNEIKAALEHSLSGLAPLTVESWLDSISGETFPSRLAALALGTMGLLAAMLAVTGIFGMAAYNVSQRRKELGIRVALGARRMQVLSAAVGRPMLLLCFGSVLGLLLGVFASRLLGQIVYQANPGDPLVVVGAMLLMALLGMAASAIPAQRALAVDPSQLMREE